MRIQGESNQSAKRFDFEGRVLENLPEVVYSGKFTDFVDFVFLNRKFSDLTGYERDEVFGGKVGWDEIVHKGDISRLRGVYKECSRSGKGFCVEYRVVRRDGEVVEVVDRGEPIFDSNAQVIGSEGMIVEVGRQKRAHRELERTQMLQSLGKLSAGIAHEINTPVQFIGDNIRFLFDSFGQVLLLFEMYRNMKMEYERAGMITDKRLGVIDTAEGEADIGFLLEEIPKAIDESFEGIRRVSDIVSAMRDFSHIDERRFGSVDMNKLIKNAVVICRNEVKYVADVEMELDDKLGTVICCMDDMNQVFLNLIVNAAHSIEEKLGETSSSRGKIKVKTFKDGDFAEILISDSGKGISEEVRERMFEPFFTTKEPGKGTGQGLSIVWSKVVDKHGGTVDVDSEVGKGSTFKVRLPIYGNQEYDGTRR